MEFRLRRQLGRLAGPLVAHPFRFLSAGVLITLVSCLGFLNFTIDTGQSLLTGTNSSTNKTYQQFTAAFGTDPLLVLFTAKNGGAFDLDGNLQRLAAFEDDVNAIHGVTSVLGPGTVVREAQHGEQAAVSTISAEYPTFVGYEYALASFQQNSDQSKATTVYQDAQNVGTLALASAVVKAEVAAETARLQFKSTADSHVLASREDAATAAAIDAVKGSLPPLIDQYIGGVDTPVSDQSAATTLGTLIAAYGDCDTAIAGAAGAQSNCQPFDEHLLLDLTKCPLVGSSGGCPPRTSWLPVLPKPNSTSGASYALVSIRLDPSVASNAGKVDAIEAQIRQDLDHGITGSDPYMATLLSQSSALAGSNPQLGTAYKSRHDAYLQLGALDPTQCGGLSSTQAPNCSDTKVGYVITGLAPLSFGIVDSMRTALEVIVPLALVVMLIILGLTLRLRGRFLPLAAAVMSATTTVGAALVTRTSLNPAVLAAVPVLIGLGVDYSIQLISRVNEERARGQDLNAAVEATLRGTGVSTAIAMIATVISLATLWLVTGVDAGPLTAVPLIALFAVVVGVGTVLAWLAAVVVSLPLAVWRLSRSEPAIAAVDETPHAAAIRPVGSLLVLAGVVSLVGWGLLAAGKVPVETDVQHLLAPNSGELQALNQVRDVTGASAEVDLFVQGDVGGVADSKDANQTPPGRDVTWQCQAGLDIMSNHPGQVAFTVGPADVVIGSNTSAASGSAKCLPPPPSPSPSSPNSTPSPSPLAERQPAEQLAYRAAAQPSPTPSSTPAPQSSTQPLFVCRLRQVPALAAAVVAPMTTPGSSAPVKDLDLTVQPCPPSVGGRALSSDQTPLNLNASRIAVAINTTSVKDEAALVDDMKTEAAGAPSGITASPSGAIVLAAGAYDAITQRGLLFNLAPLVLLGLALLLIYRRQPRRAALAVLPTSLAAGWAPLVPLLLGVLPGGLGSNLGKMNPLSSVMGALIVALGTEFGLVLLGRFYDELESGKKVDDAIAIALQRTGRPIKVSALTLGAGFAVMAASGVLPNGLPLLGVFGLSVVVDLTLAVVAVFWLMAPAAVAWEKADPLFAVVEDAPPLKHKEKSHAKHPPEKKKKPHKKSAN